MPKKRSPQQRRKTQQRSRVRRRRQADAQDYQTALSRIAADRQVPTVEALAALAASRQVDLPAEPDEYDWYDEEEFDDIESDEFPEMSGRGQLDEIQQLLVETVAEVITSKSARPLGTLHANLGDECGTGNYAEALDATCVIALLHLCELASQAGREGSKAAAIAAVEWLDAHLDAEMAAAGAVLAHWFGTKAWTRAVPEKSALADPLASAVLMLAAVIAIAPTDKQGQPCFCGFSTPED